MLIFILQSIWLYISELAGKDLEIDIVFKFLVYVSPRLIVLVLPLTILLSSIMVFGNFAENYEFAAMKSTGISLQRAMRSLAVFIVGLAITTFFFANNVIPYAEYNFYNLRKNLQKKKPAMIIAEGQFNDIGKVMNIKVEEKSGDRGQYLKDVTIHKKKARSSENLTVIKSKTGELVSSEDSDVLQLVLFDGNYYDDQRPKDIKERRKHPHVKSTFDKYTLNIDLSKLNDVDLNERNFSSKSSMLNVRDLNYTIDTLVLEKKKEYAELTNNLYNRSTITTLNKNIEAKKDSIFKGNSVYDIFQPRKKVQVIDAATNSINSTLAILNAKKKSFRVSEKTLNKHVIAFHDKFALGIACIILFFIGAPLGALIKKGGLGLPIVIAIVLFLTYHFIGIFAKNSAEDSSLNPVIASWLSTLIMFPLSIYLTNRATKDRSLFDLDSLLQPIKRLLNKENEELLVTTELEHSSEAYKNLVAYENKKLIDILKNYRQYDLDQSYKNSALQILNSRGITNEELRFGGNLVNDNYENALRYKKSYDENSKLAFVLYVCALILWISGAVMNNNGFESLGKILMIIGGIFTVLYLISYAKTFINQSKFYKLLEKNLMSNGIVLVVLGIPLYFIYNMYFKKKMKDDLKKIR